jgi:[ribosomal protein S5]-alanine N-acetyltransferase
VHPRHADRIPAANRGNVSGVLAPVQNLKCRPAPAVADSAPQGQAFLCRRAVFVAIINGVEAAVTVLETDRLVLRRLSKADAPFILRLLNDESFVRNIGDRGVRTVADAERYIANVPMASYDRFGYGLYLVESKETGEAMGLCGLVKRDALPHADIGFAFLPAYWRQGFAEEAARAVKAHARGDCRLPRLLAVVQPENQPSIRVLEKIGLQREGSVRLSADDRDLLLFGLDL